MVYINFFVRFFRVIWEAMVIFGQTENGRNLLLSLVSEAEKITNRDLTGDGIIGNANANANDNTDTDRPQMRGK